ncbi:MAG: hypothetical protein HC830_09305, partial [Bacteroidetes bacterium]|nr:hypothetical protein [Bacteroidota bacterium]
IQYDIPWPLSNQDCIVKYELLQTSSEKVFHVQMKGIPDYIPAKDGITRIDHLLGSWVITTSSSNTCKVSYTIMSGQPPKFPRWITDPIIQSNLVNTMDAFRNIAAQK